MKSYPGVAARMFRTLSDKNINISMISTSPINISVIVDADDCVAAVQALHTAFGFDEEDDGSVKVVL
jgi:aspartate kinase